MRNQPVARAMLDKSIPPFTKSNARRHPLPLCLALFPRASLLLFIYIKANARIYTYTYTYNTLPGPARNAAREILHVPRVPPDVRCYLSARGITSRHIKKYF